MSHVHIRQPHKLTKDEAKAKLTSVEAMLEKYHVGVTWKGHHASLKGMGVTGDVKVEDTFIDVSVTLGMLARAAVDPKKLQEVVEKRLHEAFGA